MNLKESIINLFARLKAVATFDPKDYAKKEELNEYIKEADLIDIINEVSNELFPEQ